MPLSAFLRQEINRNHYVWLMGSFFFSSPHKISVYAVTYKLCMYDSVLYRLNGSTSVLECGIYIPHCINSTINDVCTTCVKCELKTYNFM